MSEVVLVRHGWTAWDQVADRDWPGAMRDLAPLTPAGVARMEATAERLGQYGITAVVSSPITRALQSAHVLATRLRVPLHVEVDLHEWLCRRDGRWSGKAEFGAALAELLDDRLPESAESLAAVRDRVRAATAPYRGGGPIAVLTHNVVIYALTGVDTPLGGIVRWREDRAPESERELRSPPSLDTADPVRYELVGTVTMLALEDALTALVHRHPELGQRIARRGDRYVGIGQPNGEVACAVVDTESELMRAASEPLDPFGWPPLRAVLLPGDPAYLCLTVLTQVASSLERDPVFGAGCEEPWIGERVQIRQPDVASPLETP